jgi:hypothetical protein
VKSSGFSHQSHFTIRSGERPMFLSPSIGRRLLAGCAAAFLSVAMVACSDQNTTQPTTPEGLNPGSPSMDVSTPFTCPSKDAVDAQITNLINTLYGPPKPSKVLQAQLGKYSTFKSKLPSKPLDALIKMELLVQSVLTDLSQGKVNGIPSPAGQNVAQLIGDLACYYNYFNGTAADIPVPNLTPDLTSGTTSVGLFLPGTSQTFRSPHKFGGTILPSDAYPEALFITIEELADDSKPLLTDLDQFAKFARFQANPVDGTLAEGDPGTGDNVVFRGTTDVIVSLCQSGIPSEVVPHLRLAHNIKPFNFGDIEILPEYAANDPAGTNPAGLDCNAFFNLSSSDASEPASWLLGRTLVARMKGAASVLSPLARFLLPEAASAALTTGTTSGRTSKYSPFGAVDSRIAINKLTQDPTTAALSGGTANITETIEVRTLPPSNRVVRVAPFTFTPSQGSSATPTSGFTDNVGQASTTWSFTAPGSYALFVDVFPAKTTPADIQATSATFTATITDASQPPPTTGQLSFDIQPGNATCGGPIPGPVTVKTTPATAGVQVTLEAVNSNGIKKTVSGGGPLSTGSDGKVAFPNLSIDGTGSFNLIASAPGWTSSTSARFKVSPPCPPSPS